MSRINLAKLSQRIIDEFSVAQLRLICTELGVDAEQIGLNNPSLKKEAVIALVAGIDSQARVDDLLNACMRHLASSSVLELAEAPTDEWVPKILPQEIVEKVNRDLGIVGEPYFVYTTPAYENNWVSEPIATGCFYWRADFDRNLETRSSLDRSSLLPRTALVLKEIRVLLVGESVTVYVAPARQPNPNGVAYQSLVIAPTTNQFDILRIERITAERCDIDTYDLIEELKTINDEFGIDILAVEECMVEFKLKRIPTGRDIAKFNQWLRKIAPDVLGSKESLEEDELQESIEMGWD